jgi:hypothetical protein
VRIDPQTPTSKVERRFASHAEQIGLKAEGVLGARLYRDSQFELHIVLDSLSESDKAAARLAFNRAFDDRVVREFPTHPAAAQATERLKNASAEASS